MLMTCIRFFLFCKLLMGMQVPIVRTFAKALANCMAIHQLLGKTGAKVFGIGGPTAQYVDPEKLKTIT